jgi:hypothetical protein
MQHGDVARPDQRLRARRGEDRGIEEPQQAQGPIAAACAQHRADLIVAPGSGEIGGALLVGTGEHAVPGQDVLAEHDLQAGRPQAGTPVRQPLRRHHAAGSHHGDAVTGTKPPRAPIRREHAQIFADQVVRGKPGAAAVSVRLSYRPGSVFLFGPSPSAEAGGRFREP